MRSSLKRNSACWNRPALLLLAALLSATGCARLLRPDPLVMLAAPPQLPGPRQVIVVSDMHLGLGERAPGQPDPYEDFRWADELQRFLDAIDAAGGGATDLVLNGDTLELWQSRRSSCQSPSPDVGCSSTEALARLAEVAAAHGRELAALGRFADAAQNRIVVVPGNHDAALLYPAVAAAAVQAMGARPGRVQVSSAGYWLSADGAIYAEHGHQTGLDAANRFRDWPRPFLKCPDGACLQRPWGEQFVREFFNRYEDKYPTLDNILPLTDAAKYGLASEQVAGGAEAVRTFVDLLLRETSPAQGRSLLSAYLSVPRWDVAQIRATGNWLLGPQVLPSGDALAAAVGQAQQQQTLGSSVAALTTGQIVSLCDQRYLLNVALAALGRSTPAACPAISSVAAVAADLQRDWQSLLGEHVDAVRQALREQRGVSQPLRVFIYGHTHVAQAPFVLQRGALPVQVVNTGAWQRTTSAAWVESERQRRGLTLPATLSALRLEELPACYPLVRIAPHASDTAPEPQLQSFQQLAGAWQLRSGACAASAAQH